MGCILLLACNKEEKLAYRFAGTWVINSIELKYYSNNGQTTDSSRILSAPGTMTLMNTTDNDYLIESQFCRFDFPDEAPSSIYNFSVRANLQLPRFNCHYSAGPHTDDRLTIWSPVDILHELEMFTVVKITRKKMTLLYTRTDSDGFPAYQERWELEVKN